MEKRIYYINSNNRISGTHSNMLYKLDLHDLNPDRVAVLACNIPKSYYLIQDGSNTFTLDENGNQATITITPSNYSRTTLLNVVKTALNASSPLGYTYDISVPATSIGDTGFYTFTVTGNAGIQPDFIFGSNNLHETLGFEADTTYSFVGDTLTSVDVIKLQKEDTIYIRSNMCTNGMDNILQEIYSTSNSDFSNIVYYNPDVQMYSKKLTSNNDNIFNFYLTNENGEPMDLNGQNWQMTLIVYKNDDRFYRLFKEFSKLILSK